jgi:hypothetical protein
MTRLKWKLISICLEIVLILTQDGYTVCAKRNIGSEKSFWTHPMELLGDVGHVEAHFGPFRDSSNLDARWVHRLC